MFKRYLIEYIIIRNRIFETFFYWFCFGSSVIRTLIGNNSGAVISGDLGFTGGTSGDLTFNNSLQSGSSGLSKSELVSLLETEYLKHFSIDSVSGSNESRILSGLDNSSNIR